MFTRLINDESKTNVIHIQEQKEKSQQREFRVEKYIRREKERQAGSSSERDFLMTTEHSLAVIFQLQK